MRVINLVQLIDDYNTFFNILLDDSGISEILEDIKYKFGESRANEGDYFGLEKIRYFKNNFSLTTLFSFKVISKKYKYIIDKNTGEQVVDEVIEEVVEYWKFN